ncbi:MAG: nucleotide sugar dehydrogenase [Deltaproteobacteria bacterium]|nr:nucleotide sugar dehydrogenase [Deltaproteobacteria bacterium]
MDIGFLGLGKLGLATALAIESRGHRVLGCDPAPEVADILRSRRVPYQEEGVELALAHTRLELVSEAELVRQSELLFVAVQTPHAPEYEGTTRMPAEPADFDYSFVTRGVSRLAAEIERLGRQRVLAIVSTVLPGTIRRLVLPLVGEHARVCYNPSFIAMGTTMRDFLSPEFVLLGAEDRAAAGMVQGFYASIHAAPIYLTGIENAELIKVLYNTFISTKIAFANTAMELCHGIPGADVDEVIGGLCMGNQRVISARYMQGGMGDGGGCHPRDNIAMRHLSREVGASYDWFAAVMGQRERQTEWLATLIERHAAGRDIWILGIAFKEGSNLTLGSPALLLRNLLRQRGREVSMWDPHVGDDRPPPGGRPLCYFVGTRHAEFRSFPFVEGSVVLDPWRYVLPRPGVELIRIGVGPPLGGAAAK